MWIRRLVVPLMVGLSVLVWAADDTDYLSSDLRTRVERLKIDAATPSDDPEVLIDRLDTLWDWVNAYSLTGGTIPIDLPPYIGAARNAMRGSTARPVTPAQASELVARYTREFQIRDEIPGGVGTLELSDAGPFVVGQYVSLTQTYTVGELPMAPGGGVMVPQIRTRQLQSKDLTADGYVTLRCSNGDAVFTETEPWGQWRTFLTYPWVNWRLSGATLRAGDTVTITFGDTSGGSLGLRLETSSKDCLYLPVYVDLEGSGHMMAPEWPFYQLVGKPETRMVNAVAPSIVAPGERFELAVRSEDEYRNPISGRAPAYEVRLDGAFVELVPAADRTVSVVPGLSIDRPGVYRFTVRSVDGTLTGTSNPVWVRPAPPHRVYWGDTHGHSRHADGQGSADGYYRFGRDFARLDFLTLSEHDIWMDDSEWRMLQRMTAKYLDPGKFTTFLGYEWTANNVVGGHHNVYFRNHEGTRRVPHQMVKDLQELYLGLRKIHDDDDVVIIPHAHQSADWNRTYAPMERVVELQSGHGTFEGFANAYLRNGYVVGFIGSSDNHQQHPGYSPGTNRQMGGLAAVMADENTPDTLFDAMRRRSCYATTGERIIVDAEMGGAPMGSLLTEDADRKVRCSVMGTAPIDTIELIKNSEVVFSRRYLEPELDSHVLVQVMLDSSTNVAEADEGHFNPRGARPWRGTIEVKGARLVDVTRPWFFSPATFTLERDGSDPNTLVFSTNTRGRPKGLLLELDGATEDTEVVVHLENARESAPSPGPRERGAARLPAADIPFRLGELARGVKVHELRVVNNIDSVSAQIVPAGAALDREFEYADLSDARSGDYYYIRVTQVDGGRAWTSPVWFGQPRSNDR